MRGYKKYIIPLDEIQPILDGYVGGLKDHGINYQSLVQYAVYSLGVDSWYQCQLVIQSDFYGRFILSPQSHNPDTPMGDELTSVQWERLVHTCIDAVSETLSILTPLLIRVIGEIPRHLHLEGFLGLDVIVGHSTEDFNETQDHYTSHAFG